MTLDTSLPKASVNLFIYFNIVSFITHSLIYQIEKWQEIPEVSILILVSKEKKTTTIRTFPQCMYSREEVILIVVRYLSDVALVDSPDSPDSPALWACGGAQPYYHAYG